MNFFSILQTFAIIFFILSAYVQKNDPDPELWITLYLLPAILSLLHLLNPSFHDHQMLHIFCRLISITYIIYGVSILTSSYSYDVNVIKWLLQAETGRECAGLVICSTWTWIISRSSKKPTFLAYFLSLIVVAVPFSLWIYLYFNEAIRKKWPQHCQSVAYSKTDD